MKKPTLARLVPMREASAACVILGITVFGWQSLPKWGEQQEDAGQPCLAGIEELVDEVFFDPDVPGEEIGGEELREPGLPVQQRGHRLPGHANDGGRAQHAGGRSPPRLQGQGALAEERPSSQDGDHRLLAPRGEDGDPHLPPEQVEDGIRGITLGIHVLTLPVLPPGLTHLGPGQEVRRVEGDGASNGRDDAALQFDVPLIRTIGDPTSSRRPHRQSTNLAGGTLSRTAHIGG